MSVDLPWRVSQCTSEDPANGIAQLASDYTKQLELGGWHSRKFCDYPQALTLKLTTPANIQQIRILSHEYKIASRIELSYLPLQENEENFYLIGHLNLEPNPQDSVTRELKTIHLDITTRILRIVLYNPYQHKQNIYQQVGLIAIQLSGKHVEGYYQSQFLVQPLIQNRNPQTNFMEQLLSERQKLQENFELIDPEVKNRLQQIRIELSKDNGPYKEQLRVAERQVQQWAIQLIQLGETKSVAIENEDYMMAKKAKTEYERIMGFCLSVNTKTGASSAVSQFHHIPQENFAPVQQSLEQNYQPEIKRKQRLNKHSEEAVVPALRQGKKPLSFEEQLKLFDEQVSKGLNPSNIDNLQSLDDENTVQGLLPSSVTSELQSPNWEVKNDALKSIIDNLHQYVKTRQAISTFNQILLRLIQEKNTNIEQSTINLINALMKHDSDFVFTNSISIIGFVCDMSVEYEDLCTQTYLNFYKHLPLPLQFTIGILATKDSFFQKNGVSQNKQIQKRLTFLSMGTKQFQSLLKLRKQNRENTPYPYKYVFQMLTHTLQHSDSQIRKTSQEILFDIYRNDGYAQVKPLMESLHPTILSTLIPAIPEAANVQGNLSQEINTGWTQQSVIDPQSQSLALSCQFCGFTSEHLVHEDQLDLHYVNDCPELINCQGCRQMIEIQQYEEHKADQCEMKHLFKN